LFREAPEHNKVNSQVLKRGNHALAHLQQSVDLESNESFVSDIVFLESLALVDPSLFPPLVFHPAKVASHDHRYLGPSTTTSVVHFEFYLDQPLLFVTKVLHLVLGFENLASEADNKCLSNRRPRALPGTPTIEFAIVCYDANDSFGRSFDPQSLPRCFRYTCHPTSTR
jgi:hypothetical protein